MKSDEKFCPLCNITCKGEECAMWCFGECGFLTLANKADNISNELYHIRKEMESN